MCGLESIGWLAPGQHHDVTVEPFVPAGVLRACGMAVRVCLVPVGVRHVASDGGADPWMEHGAGLPACHAGGGVAVAGRRAWAAWRRCVPGI